MKANAKVWVALAVMAVVMAALVFGAAGTFAFWRGWVFLGVFFGASAVLTADLAIRDPALLERRYKGGPWAETRPAQRIVMAVVSIGFLALLAAPPLAWRHGWAPTSAAASIAGDAFLALGYLAIAFVFRENSFAAATVGVRDGQCVISTGPYALVRHPMYAASLVYLIGIPLALGSWWGLGVVVAMLPFLVWRLLDEERMLARELPGYPDYMQRVPWRLIPGLYWRRESRGAHHFLENSRQHCRVGFRTGTKGVHRCSTCILWRPAMSRPASSRTACLFIGAALFLGTTSASVAASDYEFLKNAIRGSNSEVFLGQLAATNASRGEVKSFGQMLVDDHSKARDEATGLVQQMGMIASNGPNSEAAEEWETLKRLKGEAFDREFVRYMINDHKKDVAAFRRQASLRPGPAKDFASRTLPTLEKHLDMAEGLTSR